MDQRHHNRHILIYVVGCPGAGKGTLCSKLATQFNWAHISVGNELRRVGRESTQQDEFIKGCVDTATLVPVQYLAQVLERRMEILRDQGYGSFIIDGFPRHTDQISYVQDKIGAPDQVIFMDCPKEVAKVRVLTRKEAGRMDNEAMFEKRYSEFRTNNADVVAHFEAEGKLCKVDTSHSTEESYRHVLAAL